MASQDLLSLSLDDIIKMKRGGRGGQRGRGRGGGGRGGGGRGGGRGGGHAAGRGKAFVGGRGGGQVAGRGKNFVGGRGQAQGARVLSTKIKNIRNKGATRGRGTAMVRGKPLVMRGRGAASNRGAQRGNIRGRGAISRGRNVAAGQSDRGAKNQSFVSRQFRKHLHEEPYFSQETTAQIRGRDAAVRQQLMRRKIQQARKTLVASQQKKRNQARLNVVDARRGLTGGVKAVKQTRSNLGTPLKVRVGSGTIVRGLRSDQLLLQKMRRQNDVLIEKKTKMPITRNPNRAGGSVVSLSSQRGLTVSIKNNIASTQAAQTGTKPRQRPRLNRNRVYQNSSTSYNTPATFTVVNDHVRPPPEPAFQVSEVPRKLTKRNIITSRDPRARMATMSTSVNVTPDSVRTIPEPHRQILDPKVQKEIAMLQGKDEVTLNSGPGPGVKGFRHIPNQTSRSLNERFTEERMVTA